MLEKVGNLAIYFKTKPDGINSETFAKEFFKKKGYNVTKKNGSPAGIPDFLCEKGKEKFYVEVKSENDSLRMTQLKWIKENYSEPVIIFVTGTKREEELIEKGNPEHSCSKCNKLFSNKEITKESGENFCYPCFRKYLFITFYENKNKKIPENIKKRIYNLKKERNINELNKMMGFN